MVDVPQARIADLPPFGVVAEPARTGNVESADAAPAREELPGPEAQR
jgi:hypothetical protein